MIEFLWEKRSKQAQCFVIYLLGSPKGNDLDAKKEVPFSRILFLSFFIDAI